MAKRKWMKVAKEKLLSEIMKAGLANKENSINPANLISSLGNDIKVKFDTENFELNESNNQSNNLIGFREIEGFTFWGITSGGDWEEPVYFLLYISEKGKLRGYVPTDGNPWNRTTKRAFGNDEQADLKDAICNFDFPKDTDCVEPGDFDFDWDKITNDICKRFDLKNKKSEMLNSIGNFPGTNIFVGIVLKELAGSKTVLQTSKTLNVPEDSIVKTLNNLADYFICLQ
jgi:hypothetical protein